MNERIELSWVGEPKAKQSTRFVRGHCYVPADIKAAKAIAWPQIMKYIPATPITAPLRVEIRFFHKQPMKWTAKHKAQSFQKTSVPDLDNLAKFVLDMLKGKFFLDDSQVVYLSMSKEYSTIARTDVDLIPV